MADAALNIPALDILVEAGDWPPELELRALAEEALAATASVLVNPGPILSRAGRGRLGASRAGEGHGSEALPGQPSPGSELRSDSTSPVPGEEFATLEQAEGELSLVFTDDAAIQRLNRDYRGKDKPTNVLSFPQSGGPLLGDIVLAWETVSREAGLAEKPVKAHMAHLIVHGFLHLLGYDHEADEEAEEMEALERAALRRMGIADPYAAARE